MNLCLAGEPNFLEQGVITRTALRCQLDSLGYQRGGHRQVSRVVPEALNAAEELAKVGIDAEVVDPAYASAIGCEHDYTFREGPAAFVASDDYAISGVGAAVISAILGEVFYHIKGPMRILGSAQLPAPSNLVLEK